MRMDLLILMPNSLNTRDNWPVAADMKLTQSSLTVAWELGQVTSHDTRMVLSWAAAKLSMNHKTSRSKVLTTSCHAMVTGGVDIGAFVKERLDGFR
eukprot:3016275-Amphidinium_carterae.2